MGRMIGLIRGLSAAALTVGIGLFGSALGPCPKMKVVLVIALTAEILGMIAAGMAEKRDFWNRDAKSDAIAVAKRERRVWIAWSAALVNAVLIVLSLGMSGWFGKNALAAVCVCVGLIWMEPLAAFVLCWPSTTQPHGRRNELREADFPEITELLRACAKESGQARRVRMFAGECGIGAFEEFGYDGILVSPLLLSVLTKEEFRQALLHEFAHLTCPKTRRELRQRRLEVRCCELKGRARSGLLSLAAERFCGIQSEYRKKIEPVRELEADSRKISPEEARAAVAAIAKAEFEIRFYEEMDDSSEDGLFSLRAGFEKLLKKRGRIWLEELEYEANCDSHPPFSKRKTIYGVTEFDAFFRESDPDWIREVNCLCEWADKSR